MRLRICSWLNSPATTSERDTRETTNSSFVTRIGGTVYGAETFKEQLQAALSQAGIEGRVRAFHDLRHASLTNGAAAGENPIALMARAGHRNMKTTQIYLHLAGQVLRDEAEALERRLLGQVESSTDLSSPDVISDSANRLGMPVMTGDTG